MQAQEHWRRLLLRTETTANQYAAAQAARDPNDTSCALCTDRATVADYTYWHVVPNKFPYDRYYSRSDMLVLKRHATEQELTAAELAEYRTLKAEVLSEEYDQILENLPQQTTIPEHFHVHLVVLRPPNETVHE